MDKKNASRIFLIDEQMDKINKIYIHYINDDHNWAHFYVNRNLLDIEEHALLINIGFSEAGEKIIKMANIERFTEFVNKLIENGYIFNTDKDRKIYEKSKGGKSFTMRSNRAFYELECRANGLTLKINIA